MIERDSVLEDEARFDRDQTAQTQRYEKALSMATEAYLRGELDGDVQDMCEPKDATKIAIAVLQHIDRSILFSNTGWLSYVSCQVRDFRATVDGVLDRHAQEILEHE
jgi:hypothetical protein